MNSYKNNTGSAIVGGTGVTDIKEKLFQTFPDGIAKWRFVDGLPSNEREITVYSVDEYKGLESNILIWKKR